MKTIKGTLTEQNLLKAFAGESQVRNRYTYFSEIAHAEGYEQIAAIFEETSLHEKEHAKRFFNYLEGGEVAVTASFHAGIIGSTKDNLVSAATGEYDEWSILYPAYAEVAQSEGFYDIAETFRQICVGERGHEARYLQLLERLDRGDFFVREEPTIWFCRNCGYVSAKSNKAPELCPACKHPKSYFEPQRYNY